MFLFNVGWYEIVDLWNDYNQKGFTHEISLNTKDFNSVRVATQVNAEWAEPSTAVIPTFHETLSVASV
jgi:hypothetical protein